MCGRYTITVTMEELMIRFLMDGPVVPYHRPRYNVAPGQMVPAIIHDGEKNRMGELKWGLIPEWAKDDKIAYKTLNARAETVAEKPAFRASFQRKRCLIPADGFYEWKRVGAGKQPMRIMMKEGGLFAMAGLYDTWIAPDGRKISSCSVITVPPNALMATIHDRMPAILRREEEKLWLDRSERDPDKLATLLRPYAAEAMEAYPVTMAVGSAKRDEPSLIERMEPMRLFGEDE